MLLQMLRTNLAVFAGLSFRKKSAGRPGFLFQRHSVWKISRQTTRRRCELCVIGHFIQVTNNSETRDRISMGNGNHHCCNDSRQVLYNLGWNRNFANSTNLSLFRSKAVERHFALSPRRPSWTLTCWDVTFSAEGNKDHFQEQGSFPNDVRRPALHMRSKKSLTRVKCDFNALTLLLDHSGFAARESPTWQNSCTNGLGSQNAVDWDLLVKSRFPQRYTTLTTCTTRSLLWIMDFITANHGSGYQIKEDSHH